jgi:hypothetical protein
MNNSTRSPFGIIMLGVLALAAIIGGVILTSSGHDAGTLWTLAGTAAGAIGGVIVPGISESTPNAPAATTYVAPVDGGHPAV